MLTSIERSTLLYHDVEENILVVVHILSLIRLYSAVATASPPATSRRAHTRPLFLAAVDHFLTSQTHSVSAISLFLRTARSFLPREIVLSAAILDLHHLKVYIPRQIIILTVDHFPIYPKENICKLLQNFVGGLRYPSLIDRTVFSFHFERNEFEMNRNRVCQGGLGGARRSS